MLNGNRPIDQLSVCGTTILHKNYHSDNVFVRTTGAIKMILAIYWVMGDTHESSHCTWYIGISTTE